MNFSERKLLAKKDQIVSTAISVIKRRGYEGATMEEIAAELLMTKGSLYYYFKSKGELMYHCYNFVLSQATEALEVELQRGGTAEEILRNMIAKHIDYAIDEKETFNLIIEPKRTFDQEQLEPVLQLRKYYAGLFDEIITIGIESQEFHVKEPLIARMMILGAMNWIQQWYQTNGRMDKAQLQETFSEYILKILK
ncbi:TetR family transcriptional regulator [Sporosarcina sp. P3]|uniref:TetR/AcrR family transcriptional regulator n=1 Tax=Sporosarcina sp. P3 TaxID=2048245 RepID=UPI000C1650CE|nr:TetR/AcrR family transcriptional regulator [Sporosarcina sp. P3]PID20365.1 TetR family transcriptional regulator [Sporosarcina sp. P3]